MMSPCLTTLPRSTGKDRKRPPIFALKVAASSAASEPVTVTARSIGRVSAAMTRTVRIGLEPAAPGAPDFEHDTAANSTKLATATARIQLGFMCDTLYENIDRLPRQRRQDCYR